ncbi:MAG: helix-turn-helix domain-containing protein [Clostridiales bacterium]|nr:helix-turn-helix domain-containing protein [Clostridiales bacterium]
MADPTTPVRDKCPMCDADLQEQVDQYNKEKQKVRIGEFLKPFYEDTPKLLETSDIADFLQTPRRYVRELIEKDKLQSYKINGKIKIFPSDLLEFIDEYKVNRT